MALLEKIGNYFRSENERFEKRSNILDYERKFIRKKKVDGKWIDWDTRTDSPPNKDAIQKAKLKLLWGSETPGVDRAYKGAEFRSKLKIQDLRNPLAARLNRLFSDRTVDGGRVIDDTRNQKEAAIKEDLAIQSAGTSYDQFLDPSSPAYKDGGKELGKGIFHNNKFIQTSGAASDFSTGTGGNSNIVNDSAKAQKVNVKSGEVIDNSDNKKTTVETANDSLKIQKGEKKYNQRLLDAGFTTDQLDKLQTQHSDWKAARKAGTLADWESKYHPDRTPKYKNRKQLKAKAS